MISELERFLAELDTGEPRPVAAMEPGGVKAVSPATETERINRAVVDLPESILTARNPLTALCRATLDSNPAAGKLNGDERRWISEHLELTVLNWLAQILKPEDTLDAACPKGHSLSEGIFVKSLVGWCCEHCRQVYPPSDCRLLKK